MKLRFARLAEWSGAEVVAVRLGFAWMVEQGWSEMDWRITRSLRGASPALGL